MIMRSCCETFILSGFVSAPLYLSKKPYSVEVRILLTTKNYCDSMKTKTTAIVYGGEYDGYKTI